MEEGRQLPQGAGKVFRVAFEEKYPKEGHIRYFLENERRRSCGRAFFLNSDNNDSNGGGDNYA
jgi:hypothetical protein